MKIKNYGRLDIPESIRVYAESIKREHYKVNTPKKFNIRRERTEDSEKLIEALSKVIDIPTNKLEYVFFSACRGAESHVDELDPEKFTGNTYVIPIVLPTGKSVITAEGQEEEVKLDHIYKFDHRKEHSMTLEDNESGCCVLMVGELNVA
jgi:hypothetical protein